MGSEVSPGRCCTPSRHLGTVCRRSQTPAGLQTCSRSLLQSVCDEELPDAGSPTLLNPDYLTLVAYSNMLSVFNIELYGKT